MQHIAATSDGLIVMAETAVRILREVYDVTSPTSVIQHGMPHIEPTGRRELKEKLGLAGRPIISTFGLVGPGKGLEYVIESMPGVVARHPDALYLIAGQTHPELLRHHGEEYRNKLIDEVESLGMADNVAFVNQYLQQQDVIEFLLASDIYVTPYLDPNQITSGTLSYALGRRQGGRVDARTCTRWRRSPTTEACWSTSGLPTSSLAPSTPSSTTRRSKTRLETNAYAYANEFTWPKTGTRFLEVMQRPGEDRDPRAEPDAGAAGRVRRRADRRPPRREPAGDPRRCPSRRNPSWRSSPPSTRRPRVWATRPCSCSGWPNGPRLTVRLPDGAQTRRPLAATTPRLPDCPAGLTHDQLVGPADPGPRRRPSAGAARVRAARTRPAST